MKEVARLGMKIAQVQISHDGVDGLPAHGDRATPWRAEGK